MPIPYANVGDPVEIRVNEEVGWVDGVISYAFQGSFIVDTEKHKRFTFSGIDHVDLRSPRKKK